MDAIDTFFTIDSPAQAMIKEKSSKVIALAYPVQTVEEVKILVEQTRKEYYDARHVCWAYMLGHERLHFRANDDGEPSATAGKPILGQINSNNLTNILILVVRYFGGILLGTSGLIYAYKTAAAEAIAEAIIVEKIIEKPFVTKFSYADMNAVMRIVKDYQLPIIAQEQMLDCTMVLSIRLGLIEPVTARFEKLDFVSFEEQSIENSCE